MKPEAILASDMLDILFENKNKEYGAYALRKNYNKRLMQAIGGTCLIVAMFIVLQSMKPVSDIIAEPEYTGTWVDIPTDNKKPKETPLKEKPKQPKAIPAYSYTTPRIVDVPETTVANLDSLNGRVISTITNTVTPYEGGNPGPGEEPKGGIEKPAETQPETAPTGPVNFAEVMPSFNGDIRKYMLRNLRQPDDLEEGQRIIVKVKFVVTKDGEIDEVQVMQSGRSDLDQEVLRVVKKMPRWNPGKQGDRNVAVYFYLPVTFVSNTE